MVAGGSVSAQDLANAKKEIEELKKATGMILPVRSHMTDEAYAWRFGGMPDYAIADLYFMKGRTKIHAEGSIEMTVENIVKTWEFERSHKSDVTKHKSLNQERFRISANGGKVFDSVTANEVGNYNVLLENAPADLWAPGQTWEGTHEAFKDAFVAFPWEVLRVFSGPPLVGFSWRHWGAFTGTYCGHKGNGELVEVFGFGTAMVDADLKLCEVNMYYDVKDFLNVMHGRQPASILAKGKSAFGSYLAVTDCMDEAKIQELESSACPATGNTGGSCTFFCR